MSSLRRSVVLSFVACAVIAALPAHAQTDFTATLYSRNEVPAVSTFAVGTFTATLNAERTELTWELSYGNVGGHVTQSHIHFAQPNVNGSIIVFLCSNLGNGPAGTQTCPASPGTISGVARAADVLAASSQGMEAGNFFEFSRAVLQGVAYANVHSDLFPGGELRGQLTRVTATGAASTVDED